MEELMNLWEIDFEIEPVTREDENKQIMQHYQKMITEGITGLKKMFNSNYVSLKDMEMIGSYARLLNATDFVRAITD